MEQYRLLLEDGRLLYAGAQESSAICDVQLTGCVNPDKEWMPGGACAAMLEVTVLDPEGALNIRAGQRLTLLGEKKQLGVFYAEKPERIYTGRYRITAYDVVSKLDRDLGQWLYDLPDWPYSLENFAQMVCRQCEVELENTPLVNGTYQIHAFSGKGITGRQLMQWICQIGGCFCRATSRGTLEFAWHRQTDICLQPTGELFYYQNTFACADYEIAPVEKVQLHLTDEDIGAVYPDEEGEKNTLKITGNYLLTNQDASALKTAAQVLYAHLKDFTYTPGDVCVAVQSGIVPGDVFAVADQYGTIRKLYAMTCEIRDGKMTVSCTGSARRDSSSAVNEARYEAISGKVLNLRADIEGVKIENADAGKNLAALRLEVEGIQSQVSQNTADGETVKKLYTELRQSAEGLSLNIQRIETEGVSRVKTGTGYTFDETGLRIQKEGQEMENLLDNTGMYVRRSGQVILQANAAGVEATDVTVRNYLVIGSHARLEDYTDGMDYKRTACFYLS